MTAFGSVNSAVVVAALSARTNRSEVLGNQITELCGYINAATCRLLEMIREFDQEEFWSVYGVCSCAHWLNWKCGIGMNAAREKVRVANALAELPKISETFARGEISYSKVRAMTRVATTDNEDYLLMIARHGTAHHMETLVRKYRRVTRLQEDDAEKQYEGRSLQFHHEDDGTVVIHVRLPAEKGALVLKALECALDQDCSEEERDIEDSTEEDDVSAETSRRRAVRDGDSFRQRRADALVDVAESYLAHGPASSAGDRYQVMLHVSAETLKADTGDICHVDGGSRVSAETARRLGCDASISVLKEGENGELLNIGRKSRIIPPAMRRALQTRDEGCRFPGCTNKHFIDGHHITHWSQGGETKLDNLVQLCRHHHRLVHEGGFSCDKGASGEVRFQDARGHLIEHAGRISPIPVTIDIGDRMRELLEDLQIDSETCVTRYDGSRMDWSMAVEGLMN